MLVNLQVGQGDKTAMTSQWKQIWGGHGSVGSNGVDSEQIYERSARSWKREWASETDKRREENTTGWLNCEARENFLYRVVIFCGKAEAKRHKDTNTKLEQDWDKLKWSQTAMNGVERSWPKKQCRIWPCLYLKCVWSIRETKKLEWWNVIVGSCLHCCDHAQRKQVCSWKCSSWLGQLCQIATHAPCIKVPVL